ncbi:TPA: cysteine--tRNA ligase [Candidatus Latescibacteria bacterium]|nr:cysteine--tRNA ligase [Candidatus Latescibacterota bacterium]
MTRAATIQFPIRTQRGGCPSAVVLEISFYNTLTNRNEPFEPLEPPIVRMYTCGPTVYDFSHIGNFRSFLFADVINRFLTAAGYDVIHAMNITDVGHMTDDDIADGSGEDKMAVATRRIKEAKKVGTLEEGAVEDPNNPYEIARYYTKAFIKDAKQLGIKVAWEYGDRVVHATDHIPEMQAIIEKLIAKDHAYVADDGVVYFSLESFPEYGRLSGNTLDSLKAGEGGRISEEHQAAKRHPADFFLWKPDPHHIMKWDSPWGTGYPGWHIECSAMAKKVLDRETIDIHTGGEDNIFPHHECEIAQSCCADGLDHFSKLWMHPRFLLVEGEKMSKSKGSFYTVPDIIEGKFTGRPVDAAVLRFELIKTHYRYNVNFTQKGIQDSARTVRRLREFREGLETACEGKAADVGTDHPIVSQFLDALANDLNMSAALAVVNDWITEKQDDPAQALGAFDIINSVLNVAPLVDDRGESVDTLGGAETDGGIDAEDWCRRLDEARKSKDYDTADALRQELMDAGYEVRTTPEGTTAQRKLA